MNRYCPITYNSLENGEFYSREGLRLLSPKLKTLRLLPYSAQEQRDEAIARSVKLSIQGVQPKLSGVLDIAQETFVLVDINGRYILKPESNLWPELPANEAISMTLAQHFKIEVPVHGLVFTKDDGLTFFIKRFDRAGRGHQKIATEDFAQLSAQSRDTKYNSSLERVIKIITEFATFPEIEFSLFFRRVLFNFIIGNEDMHLKNYSLINREGIWKLAPAYDFVNTTIAMKHPIEECALPINGRKNKLKREDFTDYLARTCLRLNTKTINEILDELYSLKPLFIDFLERSYLTGPMKESYVTLLEDRYKRLWLL